MKPMQPLAVMSGAAWNLLEAGGCRVACFEEGFEGETLAADTARMVAETKALLDAGLQAPFEAGMICSLFQGQFTQAQAEEWGKDPELPRFAACVQAVKKHLACESGENPFNVFLLAPG